MLGRTNLLVIITGVCIMNHPVLIAKKLSVDEFIHLHDLANHPKHHNKNTAYFWVTSDLTIGCSGIYSPLMSTDWEMNSAEEFLAYIEQQKLLRTIE